VKVTTPPSRRLHIFEERYAHSARRSLVSGVLFLAGQEAKRIRLRLEGSHKRLDLVVGDWLGVDDFELNTSGEKHTHNTGVGGSALLGRARWALEAVVAFPTAGTQLQCNVIGGEMDVSTAGTRRFDGRHFWSPVSHW